MWWFISKSLKMVCLVLMTRIHSLDGNIYAHLYGLIHIIILYMYIHNVPKHIGNGRTSYR